MIRAMMGYSFISNIDVTSNIIAASLRCDVNVTLIR